MKLTFGRLRTNKEKGDCLPCPAPVKPCADEEKNTYADEGKDCRLFCPTVNDEIERRDGAVSKSTLENEKVAYRQFMGFLKAEKEKPGGLTAENVTLGDLTAELMVKFERWLLSHKVKPNTSACYMRSLRSALNRLGLDGNGLFKDVRTSPDKAEKKAMRSEELEQFKQADLKGNEWLIIVRDAFFFCIMALGIPFADLIHLTRKNIKGDCLVYQRKKTGRTARVYLEKPLLDIINKYSRPDSDYLFPQLSEQLKCISEHSLLAKYNKALARISKQAGLSKAATSYTARHTWATMALRMGGNLGVISKGLTHSSLIVTQNYLKELDDSDVFELERLIIEEIAA